MESRRNVTEGFTLIELMVTITIIMLLAGMLTPAIIAMRNVFNRHNCKAQLGNIRMAIWDYSVEMRTGGVIPPSNQHNDDRTTDPTRGCYQTGSESLAHFLLGPDATGHQVEHLGISSVVLPFYGARVEEVRRSYDPDIGDDWLGLGYPSLNSGYFGRVFVDTYSTTVVGDQAKATRPILYFAADPTVAVGTNPYAIDDNREIIENDKGGFDWADDDYGDEFNEKMMDTKLGDFASGFVLLSAGKDRVYFTDDDIVDLSERR